MRQTHRARVGLSLSGTTINESLIEVGVIDRDDDPRKVMDFKIERMKRCECSPTCAERIPVATISGVVFSEEAVALIALLQEAMQQAPAEQGVFTKYDRDIIVMALMDSYKGAVGALATELRDPERHYSPLVRALMGEALGKLR